MYLYLCTIVLNSRSDLVFMTFWPNLHLSVSQVGMYVFGNSILRQKAKMFLKFELQRALSKSPIGMRCCCTEVLQCAVHVQTIMDYILHFILWNFLEEILTFVVMMMAHLIHPLLKESFARVFQRTTKTIYKKTNFCNYLLPNIFTIIYSNIWKIIGSDPNRYDKHLTLLNG